MSRGRYARAGASRARAAAVAAAVALAIGSLSGCGTVRSIAAVPGARPGIDLPSTGRDASTTPLGRPALAPAGVGGYAFTLTHDNGSAVTFDPCRPVHVAVRPDHEPRGGRALLFEALGAVSAATGLQFIDDGATTELPTEDRAVFQPAVYGDRWAPVVVAWSTPAESPMLRSDDGTSAVLGRAGPDTFGYDDDVRYVSGLAIFNGPALDAQLRLGDSEKARAVLLHELGHLVGLAHAPDPYQVMYDTNLYPLPRYRAGDLRGLEQLGMGRCYPAP